MQINFYKGLLQIDASHRIPYTEWAPQFKKYVCKAYFYRRLLDFFKRNKIDFKDEVYTAISNKTPDTPFLTENSISLRNYQTDAVYNWMKDKSGVIIMPTGAGKTITGVLLICKLKLPAIIIVPTLDLMQQWIDTLHSNLGIEIGEYSGNKKNIRFITVATYDSAYLNAEYLGNRFQLLIFDEVHHLSAQSYQLIGEMFASPYRLGLTATLDKNSENMKIIEDLVGPIVYETTAKNLKGKYLAEFEIKKVKIPLTADEFKEYESRMNIYKNYLIKNHIIMRSPRDYQKFIMRTGRDVSARNALLSKNTAEMIAYNSKSKIEKLIELLDPNNRTIIFTKFNNMAYKISDQYLIPCITYRTSRDERKDILSKFKSGEYCAIVTSQVLDEGIDVPEANVGIILSGTGSARAYIQRLGRLLRPKIGKKAILYEVISEKTGEIRTARRRRLKNAS